MILDTNALSAWAEGRPAVEDSLRSADRLVVPNIVLGEYYFANRAIATAMRTGFAATCRWPKSLRLPTRRRTPTPPSAWN